MTMAVAKVKRITTTIHHEYEDVEVEVAEVEIPDDTPLSQMQDAAEEAADDQGDDLDWEQDRADRRNQSGYEWEEEEVEYEFVEMIALPPTGPVDPALWAAAHPIGRPEDHGLTQPALIPLFAR